MKKLKRVMHCLWAVLYKIIKFIREGKGFTLEATTIVKLIEGGYTKEEIDALAKQELDKPLSIPENLETKDQEIKLTEPNNEILELKRQLTEMTTQVKTLTETIQTKAAREALITPQKESVDDILRHMTGEPKEDK